MNNKQRTTAIWIGVACAAFVLGWVLKPQSLPSSPADTESNHTVLLTPAPNQNIASERKPRGWDGTNADGSNLMSGRILSSFDIEKIGQLYKTTTDPIERRRAFADFIAGLTAENALEIREHIAHLNSDDPDFRDFHFAWGKVGGSEAIVHGADTKQRDMGPTLAGWASADPEAAKAWFEALDAKGKGPSNQEYLMASLAHGLAIADPKRAIEFAFSLNEAGNGRAKEMVGIVTGKMLQSEGTEAAKSWATSLPAGDMRGHALYEIAKAGVRENPEATAAWASTLKRDENLGSVAYGITSEWGARDGAAAVTWLDSLGSKETASAYGPALAGWAKKDPLSASEHVASMPPSENRNNAIGGLVWSYRWEDPAAAILWANEISNPKSQQDVLTLAAEAYMRKQPAEAAAWLPGSGLPVKTQERLMAKRK
jgi:hypothetical protein